jgi:polynucleotide 5'-kinase involved in rRNA processing
MMGAEPKLCWDEDKTPKKADKAWYYIVYATDYRASVIDQYDPSKIIYVGTENEFTIPKDMNPLHFKYVVTAVNRMQNESETSDVCRHEE